MSDETQRRWNTHRPALIATVLVLLVHAGLLLNVAFTTCVTHDEYWHIPAGLWNATQGRFDYENLNPPLPRVLSAIPLILAGAELGDVPADADKESRADAFMAANHDRYSHLISLARIPTIVLSLITGWVLATWALELFGPGAAVCAAALWCFSPNVLANASLVTSDAPAACAMLLVIRAAWKYAESPSWKGALWLGAWLGVAQLVKFTCLLALPMIVLIWWIRRLRNTDRRQQNVRASASQWIVLLLLSLLVIDCGFLFRGTARQLKDYQFQSQSMIGIQQAMPWASMPVLLPADYLEGIDHQRQVMEQRHPVYLNTNWSFEGFRNYFLYTWWYKTPHATQIAGVLGLLCLIWPWRERRRLRLQWCLLLPVALLLMVASLSHMQLGHRYVLPVFPFAYLISAQFASAGSRRLGIAQLAAGLILLGLVFNLRCHPHHLSYFNELSGGPAEARLLLLDSNLDWGQDLFALRKFVQENDVEDLRLAYFGMVNPVDLGIPYSLPHNKQLRPGWHAISVNFVQGEPHTIRHPDGRHDAIHYNTFGWFRLFEPHTRIHHSILVYNLTESDIERARQILEIVKDDMSL